ncbi:acetyl-CoA carboxylase carboxyltransferase subunit alpha [Marinilongibacter aquaticus]|uniref:acetyl-CoA carboxylase carboxyltransferase subunit alpha n=1 Tax=Marinilongibacter aquaticus TaxID=2975157 RepID=UPI0021BDB7AF|nr:acetyl-CoA carboxylase carboxyltransferase subunit alpha [Marinilongibacter aquaticus]UBM59795.1 acetyl-CoA carboxylase carboxyltransferase subunit alpha [Marinilongibacter aquaticus]
MRTLLEFEKPIAELEAKLEDMKNLALKNNVDVSSAVRNLTNSIEALRKETFENLTRWQRVQLSRHPDRPYSLDYIQLMCQEFHELHGDRNVRDDPAIVGGLGNIDGQTVMIIGQQKGRKTKERQYRNFGMPNPEGYRKALRLMRMAEKFNVPIVTLIDTPGAYPGLEAEERGQGEAIARNIKEMMTLKVPVICVIIGEGASGGALGIGVGDRVLMLENSWYSVISPENCSTILWKSWDFKEQAADALKLTAEDMKGFGLVDGLIEEPEGGAHLDFEKASEILKKRILKEIKALDKIEVQDRVDARIEKFCSMGVVIE